MVGSLAAIARGAAPPDADWTAFGHNARLTNLTPARLPAKAARRLQLAWTRRLDGSLVAGDVVTAAGGRSGGFEAHVAGSGVRLWRFPTLAATFEPPIETRGVVFAGDSAGNAYAFRARR